MGGHFGILATGVDNLTIDNLKIDTNRDGMDIDSCRKVRISNCSVNSPYDDGICLKADYALGYFRDVENVTITNCQVSGYDNGTFLDGTYQRKTFDKPDSPGPTGRIKWDGIERRIQEHHDLKQRFRLLPRPGAGDGGRRPSGRCEHFECYDA